MEDGGQPDPPAPLESGRSPRALPWPLVGLGILLLLGAALALGLWANQTFRPPVAIPPPPTAVRTVVVLPTATATAVPLAQPTPQPSPTVAPTPAVSAPAPTATATPWWTWSNDVPAEVQRELGEVYLNYWRVVAQAYYDLDESRLSEVEAGEELARDIRAIGNLRAAGRAHRLILSHSARVLYASQTDAVIYDEYLSSSVYVVATTGEEIPTDIPPATQRLIFRLQKFDDHWKVTDGVRLS